jgi:hypothetical protein
MALKRQLEREARLEVGLTLKGKGRGSSKREG